MEATRTPEDRAPEDRIRERAYSLWEAEGCPDGCADRHWQQAEAELFQGSQDQGSQDQGFQDQELAETSATDAGPGGLSGGSGVPGQSRRKARAA